MTKYEMMKEFESELNNMRLAMQASFRNATDQILNKLATIDGKCDIIIAEMKNQTVKAKAKAEETTSSIQLELAAIKEFNKAKAELAAARSGVEDDSSSESYAVSDFNGSI